MSTALALYNTAQQITKFRGDLDDIARFLTTEGTIDLFFAKIATGSKIDQIADSIGLTSKDMDYIFKCTPDNQKKLLSAKAVYIGDKSMDTLMSSNFLEARDLDKEENNAAKHHKGMAELALKVTDASREDGATAPIVHNNITIVQEAPPPVPAQLGALLEHEGT